jgi:hypothetical protein
MELIAKPRPIFFLNGEIAMEGVHYLVDTLGAPQWVPDVRAKFNFGDIVITLNPAVPDGFGNARALLEGQIYLGEKGWSQSITAMAEAFHLEPLSAYKQRLAQEMKKLHELLEKLASNGHSKVVIS